jgi:hypothetical protein
MRDHPGYRLNLAIRRLATVLLRSAFALRVRWRRRPPPAPVTGTVVLLDRCLGLGDALMISPALRLLAPLGPVTVVTALPPFLDWGGDSGDDPGGEWLTCSDWSGMVAAVNRRAATGRLLLVPRLGLAGLLTLLRWPGGLPAAVVRLGPALWIDTTNGRRGAISGHHYTDGALACAAALRDLATGSGTRGAVPAEAEVPRLPPRLPPGGGAAVVATLNLPDRRPLVALAPWATSRIRRWPIGHWSRLIDHLTPTGVQPVFVLLGAVDERRAGDDILGGLSRNPRRTATVINLIGRLSLAETAAVVARAALLIACDNGILHFGLGLGTPVVAIFGSTDPAARLTGRRWRLAADPGLCPYRRAPCYPDLHRDPSCPGAVECLSGLAPERVAGLALDLLTRPRETA